MNPNAAAKLGIKPFDAAEYLHTKEDCAQYLEACLESAPDDAALFSKALGNIARAKGMAQLARDANLSREGLYKALGEQGNPSFGTVLKVMQALGLRVHVEAVPG